MIRRLLLSMAVIAALAGCGTVVFTNSFIVTVQSSGPAGVSIFDPQQGDTRDWAERTLGTAAPGQPYRQQLNTTGTKVIGDSGPPRRVTAGLYLPDLDDSGYFVIAFDPVAGESTDYAAGFVSFTGGPGREPLPLILTTVTSDDGWEVAIEVPVPAD